MRMQPTANANANTETRALASGFPSSGPARLAFHSQDLKLRPLLAPALGREFQVTVEPDREKLHALIAKELCDVLILDLDSTYCPIAQQVSFFEEAAESGIAIVVMTDDAGRSTAIELV